MVWFYVKSFQGNLLRNLLRNSYLNKKPYHRNYSSHKFVTMPRFGLNDDTSDGLQQSLDSTADQNMGGETGDASCNPTPTKDESKSVSEQKREFIKYLSSKKTPVMKFQPSDNAVLTTTEPWDYKPDINCILKSNEEDKEVLFDGCSPSAGSDGDHFYRVYKEKSPSAVRAASLLDELVELREELSGRIKDLVRFKQDIRGVSQLIREGPRAEDTDQGAAGRAGKVVDSVELTTHRIESLCSELDLTHHHLP